MAFLGRGLGFLLRRRARARLARWRQSVPSSVLFLVVRTARWPPVCFESSSPHARGEHADAPRPACRHLIECNGFSGDREPSKPTGRRPRAARPGRADGPGTACPGTSSRAPPGSPPRTANRSRPGCCRPARRTRPSPSRYGSSHAVRLARRVAQRCWCSRRRGRSSDRSTASAPPRTPRAIGDSSGGGPDGRVVVVERLEERLAVEGDREPPVHHRRPRARTARGHGSLSASGLDSGTIGRRRPFRADLERAAVRRPGSAPRTDRRPIAARTRDRLDVLAQRQPRLERQVGDRVLRAAGRRRCRRRSRGSGRSGSRPGSQCR